MPDKSGQVITLDFGECIVQVWPEGRYLQTVYRDGSIVEASPEDTDSYRIMAKLLGYGDNTWAMCLEHEILHTMLSKAHGRAVSPTLHAVAHGTENILSAEMIANEEADVLEFQRRLNACRK